MENSEAIKPNSQKMKFAVDSKLRFKMDDEPETTVDLQYEVIVTTESVEYFVQNIASAIASVASRIAEPANGSRKSTSGTRPVKPAAPAVS